MYETYSVINAAGNFGDVVERLRFHHSDQVPFEIRPRKGQFVMFAVKVPVLTRVIQPVPTERTKGVFVFPTLYGHIVVSVNGSVFQLREITR
jgi:glycerol-3-phosphate dehydrogenase